MRCEKSQPNDTKSRQPIRLFPGAIDRVSVQEIHVFRVSPSLNDPLLYQMSYSLAKCSTVAAGDGSAKVTLLLAAA